MHIPFSGIPSGGIKSVGEMGGGRETLNSLTLVGEMQGKAYMVTRLLDGIPHTQDVRLS